MGTVTGRAARALAGGRTYAAAGLFRWRAPRERFVVLTTPRTGSQVLVELLDAHRDICCEGEILSRPPRAPLRYLQGRAVEKGRGFGAYGFKLMAHHVGGQPGFYPPLREFVAQLDAGGFRLVVLRRRNRLDQALSYLAATQVGYHPRQGDGVAVERLHVDPADVVFALVLIEQQCAALEDAVSGLASVALTYEDDLVDVAAQRATVGRLCDWLAVRPAQVGTDLVRPAPGGLSSFLADPGAVATALRTTRFAALADELSAPETRP